jgi:hypothetical protein
MTGPLGVSVFSQIFQTDPNQDGDKTIRRERETDGEANRKTGGQEVKADREEEPAPVEKRQENTGFSRGVENEFQREIKKGQNPTRENKKSKGIKERQSEFSRREKEKQKGGTSLKPQRSHEKKETTK